MTKALAPIDDIRNSLTKMTPQFKMALPANVSPEKFVRIAVTSIQNNPSLLNCNKQSLFSAAMRCAQSGLLPDGREAAIVPFKDSAQFMPMVGGILKMVRNSGELSSINAHVVHENDEFHYWIDEKGEHLKHTPNLKTARGKVTHAYAIASTKDGGVYIEVMSKEDLDKVRESSRSKNSGPWTQWESEMQRKTVIRRLSKRLPMSTDLEGVIRADDEMYEVEANEEEAPKKKPQKKSSRLSSVVSQEEPLDVTPQEEPAGVSDEDLPI